jgi:pyruvate decarboxylase
VAGAYAERLPVIFVASGYNTNDATASHLLHHSLGTHDLSYQYEMSRRYARYGGNFLLVADRA